MSSLGFLATHIRATLREGNIPINILLRIYSLCHASLVLGIHMLAQWKLDKDPADGFIYIELSDFCNYLVYCCGCVELDMCEFNLHFCAGLRLHPDVCRAIWSISSLDDDKMWAKGRIRGSEFLDTGC